MSAESLDDTHGYSSALSERLRSSPKLVPRDSMAETLGEEQLGALDDLLKRTAFDPSITEDDIMKCI